MIKPKLKEFTKPKHISDYPIGPCYEAGSLVTKNLDWRSEKPMININKCIACYQCYLCCPEGVIYKHEKKVSIDYDYCKGCGICAKICPVEVIQMVKEGDNNE